MSLAAGIKAHALADTDMVAEIGARLYFKRAPQDVPMPYGVFRRISMRGENAHLTGGPSLFNALYQFDWYASDPATVERLADAARRRFAGYSGPMGDVTVQACLYVTENDDIDDPQEGGEGGIHWIPQEFEIIHLRAAGVPR